MIHADVLAEIKSILSNNNTVALLLGSKVQDGGAPAIQRLNITEEVADDFRVMATNRVQSLLSAIKTGDTTVVDLDQGYSPGPDEIDYAQTDANEHVTTVLKGIPTQPSTAQLFQDTDDFLATVSFYCIAFQPSPAGDPVFLFRTYSAQKELSRSRFFAIFLADGQYDRIRTPTFLFDHEVDCIAYGKHMYIFNRTAFQRIFRYFEHLNKIANACLAVVRKAVPISNFDAFAESCRSHLQKLSKLKNISEKPYLKQVTMNDIIRTIKKHALNVKVKAANGKKMLVFDPSDRWVILKLLDDDYLGSTMTRLNYEANSKRRR
jgi:hypothetical protein